MMIRVFSNTYRILKDINVGMSHLSTSAYLFRFNSNDDKEIGHNHVPQTGRTDILLNNIKSASNTSDLLHSVKLHNTIMNNRHLIQAFRSMFYLQKAEKSYISNREITQSQEFKILCQILKSQVRILDLDDRVDILKTLSFLGVPATSKIVQVLLKTVTSDLNDLTLQQITFLDFLIKEFESCPLVDALHIALPVVFEANLRLKVDQDSLSHLTELLQYATSKNLSSASLFLINLLMTKRANLDFKSSRSIIRSICTLKVCDGRHRPLLHHALDIMVDNESKCTYQDYDLLLSQMVTRYSPKNSYFYHEEFLNSACKFIITNNTGFTEGVWILRKSNKYGHVCRELLDYLLNMIECEPHLIENCGTVILFSIVGGLAQADYRPSNWNTIEPLIIKNALSHIDHIELPWAKFARDLCSLDCWPFEIFQRLFSNDFLDKYLAREFNILDHLQVLALYQAVKVFCPEYGGPWPPPYILEKGLNNNGSNVTEFPLKNALSQGFGGSRYVINGVFTKLGHFIDHLLTFRKGGYPVPFTNVKCNGKVYIEDLPKIDECQMVAILFLSPNAFNINTNQLKGSAKLTINSLETYGPSVVYINSSSWEQMLDSEKIPYLMDLIKTKCSF